MPELINKRYIYYAQTFFKKCIIFFGFSCLGFIAIHYSFAQNATKNIYLPVRVHILSSTKIANLDSNLTDIQISQLFQAVNKIWKRAHIVWEIESIMRRAATNERKYLNAVRIKSNKSSKKRSVLPSVCATDQWLDHGWNVCIIKRFSKNAGGIYINRRGFPPLVIFAERSPRGELRPEVLAHELGHSLGLPHASKYPDNLMTGKGNNMRPRTKNKIKKLTFSEINRARKQADFGRPYRKIAN